MPEPPEPRPHVHPMRRRGAAGAPPAGARRAPDGLRSARRAPPPYAELHCRTNFSFLRGASHPEELVAQAGRLGYRALAITDRNSLAGVVRAHVAARECGLPLIIGAEVVPADAPPVVLLAPTRSAYGRLCRLLTVGRRRAPKGDCRLHLADVAEHSAGLIALCVPRSVRRGGASAGPVQADVKAGLEAWREVFGDRAYLLAEPLAGTDPRSELERLSGLSRRVGLPLVAGNDVYYHVPQRRIVQDVLTCIRHGCTLEEAGSRLLPNGWRHLLEPQEVARRFAGWPEAAARTVEIAEACRFSLEELKYEYPEELAPRGLTPMAYLRELTWAGARERYGGRIPERVRRLLEHELRLIEELGYEAYFLTVWDVVRFARSRGILCQGRGSAANSAVCYCLGITAVDPDRMDVLFERFVSRERNEPPDIDVDFEHERREEVFEYIYNKYGRERAAITAEVITYRPRSAVRDAGKALGLSPGAVDALARRLDWWEKEALPAWVVREAGLDIRDRRVRLLRRVVGEMVGFPRHLSQHVGGFVITRGPLCETVPIENGGMEGRTFIQWDKDDLDALGMLKVDCLALGMLTCLRKCFDLINSDGRLRPARPLHLGNIPPEDPAVYDMLCAADSVGVFQVESRAQMSMLPRLRPRCFYDLVIEVAIVRPGPIQGGMVHPYLRRRCGEEPVTYPSEAVREVLSKTLGVPLFQEQAMRLAVVAAGFTPGEADRLRRAMAAWRRSGDLEAFRRRLIEGMVSRGYPRDFAQRCFEQIRGFGEYGFPESHAASFALLVYVSAWLKRYYPAAYAAALLNSQPMGFYSPAQIVRDAQAHGVRVLPPDVNYSEYDCTLEWAGGGKVEAARPAFAENVPQWGAGGPALRLGLRLIRGVSEAQVRGLKAARSAGPIRSIGALWRRGDVSRETLLRLAAAGAFGSLGLTPRQAVWQVLGLGEVLPLFAEAEGDEAPPALPEPGVAERVVQDYAHLGLSLEAHPMGLVRGRLEQRGVKKNSYLRQAKDGERVGVAGVVVVRQAPSTARGIIFITLEDETGVANLVVRPKVWARYRSAARTAVALIASGVVERQGEVVHVVAERLTDLTAALGALRSVSHDFH